MSIVSSFYRSPKIDVIEDIEVIVDNSKMDNVRENQEVTSGDLLTFLKQFKNTMEIKIETMETKIDDTKVSMEQKIEATNKKIDDRMNKVEDDLATVNDKMGRHEELSKRMETRLDALELEMGRGELIRRRSLELKDKERKMKMVQQQENDEQRRNDK